MIRDPYADDEMLSLLVEQREKSLKGRKQPTHHIYSSFTHLILVFTFTLRFIRYLQPIDAVCIGHQIIFETHVVIYDSILFSSFSVRLRQVRVIVRQVLEFRWPKIFCS
mmetsp:Transcript_19859/g.28706  ORF Transcript_19859/g.28706 Transcript_19859/m.28706 type:complete len:109 (-) Transcript_19859:237-563(-)